MVRIFRYLCVVLTLNNDYRLTITDYRLPFNVYRLQFTVYRRGGPCVRPALFWMFTY